MTGFVGVAVPETVVGAGEGDEERGVAAASLLKLSPTELTALTA